ncbi:ATPase family associated with various cellular activities-domain-containing protein [Coprinopsis sp. MPI-PUGE-AT-0042]|nr:ATPase family associated with various cellular activities-domain-containing protein [Coprinopsis sp. MPI-PUGE-AT-0042]
MYSKFYWCSVRLWDQERVTCKGPASSAGPLGLPSAQHAKEARRVVWVELGKASQLAVGSSFSGSEDDARNSLWRGPAMNETKTVDNPRKGKEKEHEDWLSTPVYASVDQGDNEGDLSSALGNMDLYSEGETEGAGAMQLSGSIRPRSAPYPSLFESRPYIPIDYGLGPFIGTTSRAFGKGCQGANRGRTHYLPPTQTRPDAKLPYTSFGGLSKQIEEIREPQTTLWNPPRRITRNGQDPPRTRHRAVDGIERVGHQRPELSSAYHGQTESKVAEVFKEAHAKIPCIIALGEVDALVLRREDSQAGGTVEKRVVATLLTILDGIGDDDLTSQSSGRVVLIGTTNCPNAIDPALRKPRSITDAPARLSILTVLLCSTPQNISPKELEGLASKAHGYMSFKNYAKLSSEPYYTQRRSRGWVRGLQKGCGLGGLTAPNLLLGVLPYAPAGCSKTVLVRRFSTKSGMNLSAVQGPELLNKFVGESKKAVREACRKDGINALATSRASVDTSGPPPKDVLTSLLNETDDVQELVGVAVVAATIFRTLS